MYLAEVHGNPFFKTSEKTLNITFPIMHHRFDDQKMIVLVDEKDEIQGR